MEITFLLSMEWIFAYLVALTALAYLLRNIMQKLNITAYWIPV